MSDEILFIHLDFACTAYLDRLAPLDVRASHAAGRFGRYVGHQECMSDARLSTNGGHATHVHTNPGYVCCSSAQPKTQREMRAEQQGESQA